MKNQTTITAHVKKLDGKIALLTFPDGQELSLAIDKLPTGAAVDDEINITLAKEKISENLTDNQAKQILNQILKPDE